MKKLNVLVACECSQIVTTAFRNNGHNAWSCDILPSYGEYPKYHIQDDVMNHLNGWDMIIAFPPCTILSNVQSGPVMRNKIEKGLPQKALNFIKKIWDSCDKVCIENPISSYLNNNWIPYSQIIQPYHFGHNYSKTTCLWLKDIPPLISTVYNDPSYSLVWTWNKKTKDKVKPPLIKHKDLNHRRQIRSQFHSGVAEAMVNQWT